jgi:hypothetical protein
MTEFSDDELSFLRYARFGELPARVHEDDRVELVETERPQLTRPDPAGTDDQSRALGAGG